VSLMSMGSVVLLPNVPLLPRVVVATLVEGGSEGCVCPWGVHMMVVFLLNAPFMFTLSSFFAANLFTASS